MKAFEEKVSAQLQEAKAKIDEIEAQVKGKLGSPVNRGSRPQLLSNKSVSESAGPLGEPMVKGEMS
jgi:hypothetical protein